MWDAHVSGVADVVATLYVAGDPAKPIVPLLLRRPKLFTRVGGQLESRTCHCGQRCFCCHMLRLCDIQESAACIHACVRKLHPNDADHLRYSLAMIAPLLPAPSLHFLPQARQCSAHLRKDFFLSFHSRELLR